MGFDQSKKRSRGARRPGRLCRGRTSSTVETLVAVHYIVTRCRWKLAAGCDRSFSRFPLPYPSQGLLIDIEPIQK